VSADRPQGYWEDIDRALAYQEALNTVIADARSDEERLAIVKATVMRISKRARISFADAVQALAAKVHGTRSEPIVRRLAGS